jgi:hypothetical protein
VLDSQHGLARTEACTISLKRGFAIEQELHCPTVQLLRFKMKTDSS